MTIKIADKFELWPIADLVPYERNSRTHPEDQVAGIASSIREFGFIAPIVVDTTRGRIAAGHGRLLAPLLPDARTAAAPIAVPILMAGQPFQRAANDDEFSPRKRA